MKRAIREHWKDFAAIVALLVITVGVAGYILSNERLRFPWQASPYTINAAFSTAQAVTPGQGQSVRISGVQVGLVGQVTLKNGEGIVQMQIDPKYKNLVHTDWSALIRPRTGLDDMFIELSPGPPGSPVAKSGYTIPVSNTMPVVNLDEILSSLDADSREYLDLLVNGAGQGLANHGGDELAQVMARFEPTHRDLARVNSAVAVRGRNLQRLVNSLRRLNDALAAKQTQIVQLVDSSEKVFGAFASEDANVSRAVADLPGTLQQTTATLAKVQAFATQLGPAAKDLLPAAAAIPGANAAVSAWLAAGIARTAGSRFTAVGPKTLAKASTLPSVVVVCCRVPGRSATARLTFVSSEANAANTFSLESISWTIWTCFAASASFRRRSELTNCWRSAPRWATALFSRARSWWVGSKRSITWASSSPP